jgi:hypothetical protein
LLHGREEGMFGCDSEEVTGRWRRLHIEGRLNLYFLPYADKVIKSRRLGWVGDVARMGQREIFPDFVLKPRRDGSAVDGSRIWRWVL